MQTSSIHKTVNYAIVGADYRFGINNKKQRTETLEKLNASLDVFRNENSLYFEPQNVLILWKNNPDENYLSKKLGHSNDTLIKMFCERIVYEAKSKPIQLFIDTPQTLLEEGKSRFTVLERLIMIWKETRLIPVLLDDDFLSFDNNALMGKEGWLEEMHLAANDVERLKILYLANEKTKKEKDEYFELVRSYYEHFYTSIEKLLAILQPKTNVVCEEKGNFIRAYFLWQAGIYQSVETAQEEENMDKPLSTWYRYGENFENNIVYEEYTVVYWRYLCIANDDEEMKQLNPSFKKDGLFIRPKKGNMPDAITYIGYLHICERRSFFEPEFEYNDPYDEFREIRSKIDVKRVENAANIKIKNLKIKGRLDGEEIKVKLKKWNGEETDLYSITSDESLAYEAYTNMIYDESYLEGVMAGVEEEGKSSEEIDWQEFVNENKQNIL